MNDADRRNVMDTLLRALERLRQLLAGGMPLDDALDALDPLDEDATSPASGEWVAAWTATQARLRQAAVDASLGETASVLTAGGDVLQLNVTPLPRQRT